MADWLQKEQTQFVIITGDGTAYLPDYMTATVSKELEFNISKFEFVGIDGSLVVRKEAMGIAYDIEMIFQGANHLDTSDAFLASSKNKEAWQISHPMYGGLTVQPLTIKFDNGVSNITTIKAQVIETILSGKTTPVLSPPDKINNDALQANQTLAATYVNDVPEEDVSSLQALAKNINGVYNSIQGSIADVGSQIQDYKNIYNQAITVLNNVTSDALNIISSVQALIVAPALFIDSVIKKIASFETMLTVLNQNITAIANAYINIPKEIKKLFENNGGSAVSGICIASVTNLTSADYNSRKDVLNVMQSIIGVYNNYLTMLDSLQTATGGELNSYIPNPDALFLLDGLVNYTIISLFDIANNAKQERYYALPEDSNVILVAYLLYDLEQDDSTIDYLISTNNIVGYELLALQKGRQLVYYV